MDGPLFSFRAVPALVGLLGTDARRIFRAAGLETEPDAPELIAPLGCVRKLFDLAAQAKQRPAIGIDVAELVPSGTLGFTEFLMRSAPTVMRGLEVLCEFAPLINPILDFRLESTPQRASMHFAIPGEREALGVHLNEYTFALMFQQFSRVLGESWRPTELWLAHERSSHRDDVAARFGCAVTFGAGTCGVAMDRAAIDRKPPTADPVLFDFLREQARAQLSTLEPSDVAMVARTIEARLSGDVSVEAIAAAMATTSRSLQRHLAAAGTSYRDVLQQVRRRQHAELSRAGVSEDAIARKLGFVDTKSMRRSLVTEGRAARRR